MEQQVITKQIIINESTTTQYLSIADQFITILALGVAITEIGLYATNLNLDPNVTRTVQGLPVTFSINPDSANSFVATITIPYGTYPNPTPIDLVSDITSIHPMISIPPTIGTISAPEIGGRANAIVLPLVIAHHFYKHSKENSKKALDKATDKFENATEDGFVPKEIRLDKKGNQIYDKESDKEIDDYYATKLEKAKVDGFTPKASSLDKKGNPLSAEHTNKDVNDYYKKQKEKEEDKINDKVKEGNEKLSKETANTNADIKNKDSASEINKASDPKGINEVKKPLTELVEPPPVVETTGGGSTNTENSNPDSVNANAAKGDVDANQAILEPAKGLAEVEADTIIAEDGMAEVVVDTAAGE